jgi:hypothetical protein
LEPKSPCNLHFQVGFSGVEMSNRSMCWRAGLVLVTLGVVAGGCAQPDAVYTGPGWYLEKPRQLFMTVPQLFKGPMSYDECEIERKKLPDRTAELMLCTRELTQPGPYGIF